MAETALAICFGFVFIVLGLLSGFYMISIYNGLIVLRNNTGKAWSNIDVLLKQRNDLIPNIVEIVKGYTKYEREVLTEITKLRTSVMKAEGPAEKAKTSEAISGALKTLFAVSENYPKLKASDNFLKLQEQLAAIENQIADRREFYNDSVLLFNTRIQVFPDSIIAGIFGMKQKEYFSAEPKEKQAIEVRLTR